MHIQEKMGDSNTEGAWDSSTHGWVDMEPGALRRRLDGIYLHRREHVSPNLPETQPVSVEIRPWKRRVPSGSFFWVAKSLLTVMLQELSVHHAAWFFAHCIFLISTRVALLDLLRVIGTVRAVEGRRNCSRRTCKISSQLLSVCTVEKCWSTCFCVIQLDDCWSHLGTSEQLYAWSCNLKFPRRLLRQFGTGLGFWWMFLVLK